MLINGAEDRLHTSATCDFFYKAKAHRRKDTYSTNGDGHTDDYMQSIKIDQNYNPAQNLTPNEPRTSM